jgi:hypothetical protein
VLAIQRGLFAATTSALSLVDHSRRIRKKVGSISEEYDERVREIFEENEHRFIQDLRNYICHFRILKANWQRTYSVSGRQTQFLLQQEDLLKWNEWDKQARNFIKRYPKGIDVEGLFNRYRIHILEFHKWFCSKITQVSEPYLSEYRGYEKSLKGFGAMAWWKILLMHIINNQIDPFKRLHCYLKESELAEVLTLPMKSRAQIDRIIEILDEDKFCDDELRAMVYRAFNAT